MPPESEPAEAGGFVSNRAIPERLQEVMRRVAAAKGAGEQKESEARFAEQTSRNLQAALTEFGMTASCRS